MPSFSRSSFLLALVVAAGPVIAADHRIASAADLDRLAGKLSPGDTVVLGAGTWTDQSLVFRGTGTASAPVTRRPLSAQDTGPAWLPRQARKSHDGRSSPCGDRILELLVGSATPRP